MAKGQDKGGKDKAQNKDKKKLTIKEKKKLKNEKKARAEGKLNPTISSALKDNTKNPPKDK